MARSSHTSGTSAQQSAVAEMGDRLATIDTGRKLGAVPALFLGGGGVGSPCNTVWPGPIFVPSGVLILIHLAIWPQQTWAKNWGGAVHVPHGGGAGSASNTMLAGPRPNFVKKLGS